MRSPTPCQEHYQTNTKRGPPEQLFLQSYTGDHGRPADRAPGGQPTAPKWGPPDADSSAVVHSEGVQQDATKSRILLLLAKRGRRAHGSPGDFGGLSDFGLQADYKE